MGGCFRLLCACRLVWGRCGGMPFILRTVMKRCLRGGVSSRVRVYMVDGYDWGWLAF
jgi:hypothetical protein